MYTFIHTSAWKQFFFIDCLGLGEIFCRSSRKSCRGTGGDTLRLSRPPKFRVDDMSHRQQPKRDKSRRAANEGSQTTRHGMEMRARDEGGMERAAKQQIVVDKRGRQAKRKESPRKTKASAVKSPSNKALIQADPLFHLYLICVGLITLSILAIKCLIPGMPIYTHTVIGFAFLLVIILVSTIYTQVKSKKVSVSRGQNRDKEREQQAETGSH